MLFSFFQVLKSIALLRSGKYEECEKLISEVKKMEICDDPTLQAMTICYREMEKREYTELLDCFICNNRFQVQFDVFITGV